MDEEICINFREVATLEFWNRIAEGYYNAGILDQRNPDLAMLRRAESLWEQLADIDPNESCYAQGLQKTRSAIAVAMKKYEALKREGRAAASRQPVRADLNEYIARAKQGDLKAQMNLAYFYLTGEGVTKDETEAYAWLLMAVKQKNGTACYNMGQYFANGYGVPQNYADAAQWFEMAAGKGFAKAQYNLAFYYERGQGILQDYEQAAEWYLMAAKQGDVEAKENLLYCVEHMSDISRELWRATVREAGLAEAEKSGKAGDRNTTPGIKTATQEKKQKGGLFGRLRKK